MAFTGFPIAYPLQICLDHIGQSWIFYLQIDIAITDSIQLNNDANFDNLHAEDDYDSYQPNYIHQIIHQHDYSNNVSSNEPTGQNTNADNSTSHSGRSSHNGDPLAHMTKNYGLPTPGEHFNPSYHPATSLQHQKLGQEQTLAQQSLVEAANEAFKNIDVSGLAPTLDEIVPDLSGSDQASVHAVNPFFMQHPFFKQQFEQQPSGQRMGNGNGGYMGRNFP